MKEIIFKAPPLILNIIKVTDSACNLFCVLKLILRQVREHSLHERKKLPSLFPSCGYILGICSVLPERITQSRPVLHISRATLGTWSWDGGSGRETSAPLSASWLWALTLSASLLLPCLLCQDALGQHREPKWVQTHHQRLYHTCSSGILSTQSTFSLLPRLPSIWANTHSSCFISIMGNYTQ